MKEASTYELICVEFSRPWTHINIHTTCMYIICKCDTLIEAAFWLLVDVRRRSRTSGDAAEGEEPSVYGVLEGVILRGRRVEADAVERVLRHPAVHREPGVVPGGGPRGLGRGGGGRCCCCGCGGGGGCCGCGRSGGETGSQPLLPQTPQTKDAEPPEALRLLRCRVAVEGRRRRAGGRRGRLGRADLGHKADGPLAVQRHDLLDAVPVGLGQGEAAGRGAGVVAHHAQPGLRGVAVCLGGDPELAGVQQTPVVAARG